MDAIPLASPQRYSLRDTPTRRASQSTSSGVETKTPRRKVGLHWTSKCRKCKANLNNGELESSSCQCYQKKDVLKRRHIPGEEVLPLQQLSQLVPSLSQNEELNTTIAAYAMQGKRQNRRRHGENIASSKSNHDNQVELDRKRKRKPVSASLAPSTPRPSRQQEPIQQRSASEPRWLPSTPPRSTAYSPFSRSVFDLDSIPRTLFNCLNSNSFPTSPLYSTSDQFMGIELGRIKLIGSFEENDVLRPVTPSRNQRERGKNQALSYVHHSENLISDLWEKMASIISIESKYRAFLRLQDQEAQKLLDALQLLLDFPQTDVALRRKVLVALLRLSKKSALYPQRFTLKGIESDRSPIAGGHFGDIWKGRYNGQAVCLKVVKVYAHSQIERILQAYSKEAILWGQLSHTNLLPFYGIYDLEDAHQRICLISPWMENGSVIEYLVNKPDVCRKLLVSDVAQGLLYLHFNDVIHGDLKGANILVNAAGRACLADFGLSTIMETDAVVWTSMQSSAHSAGTIRWQAPELIDPYHEDARVSKESDVYAFACVCYEIFTGRVPFSEVLRDATVIYKIMHGERPTCPPNNGPSFCQWGLTEDMWNLMNRCWDRQPAIRPAIEVVADALSATVLDNKHEHDWGRLAPSYFRLAMYNNLEEYCKEIHRILTTMCLYEFTAMDKIASIKGRNTPAVVQLLTQGGDLRHRQNLWLQLTSLASEYFYLVLSHTTLDQLNGM